jgi:hypothetical protein
MIANSLVVLALWLVFGAATAVIYVRLMRERKFPRPSVPPRDEAPNREEAPPRDDEREAESGRHEVAW